MTEPTHRVLPSVGNIVADLDRAASDLERVAAASEEGDSRRRVDLRSAARAIRLAAARVDRHREPDRGPDCDLCGDRGIIGDDVPCLRECAASRPFRDPPGAGVR